MLQKTSFIVRHSSLVALCVIALPAWGDHLELAKPLSPEIIKLESLINEALEKNSDLRASRQEVISKDAEIGPAGAYDDPMLSLEAMNYPINTLSAREYGMTGNQISLSQKIPFPGKLSKKRSAVFSASEAQKEVAERKRLEVIRDIKVAYYDLYLAYKKYDNLNEQKGLFAQLVTVTRNNYSLNKASQAEVLNLQVEQASLIDQLLTAETQIKNKLGEINHLVGRADHSQYLYGRPEELRKTSIDLTKHSEKVLLERASAKSPLIKEKRARVSSADATLSFAKWNYLPDFEFRAGYTQRETNAMDDGTDFVSVMVGVSIPLWAGSKQSEEKRGAAAEKIRTEALLDEERINLAHMIHVIYAELEEAHKRVRLFESGVLPLTRQAVVSSRSAYLTRKIEYSTLLSAINKRFQMEIGYAEALAAYQSKIAQLEALIGESLE